MPDIPRPPTPSIWGWMENLKKKKKKTIVCLFNIHEFKDPPPGGGRGAGGGRESQELSNLGFQSNSEQASAPACSLSFVSSALGCLRNVPTLVFQAQNHLYNTITVSQLPGRFHVERG